MDEGFLLWVVTLPFLPAKTKVLCCVLTLATMLVCCHVYVNQLWVNITKIQTLYFAPSLFSFDSNSPSDLLPSSMLRISSMSCARRLPRTFSEWRWNCSSHRINCSSSESTIWLWVNRLCDSNSASELLPLSTLHISSTSCARRLARTFFDWRWNSSSLCCSLEMVRRRGINFSSSESRIWLWVNRFCWTESQHNAHRIISEPLIFTFICVCAFMISSSSSDLSSSKKDRFLRWIECESLYQNTRW